MVVERAGNIMSQKTKNISKNLLKSQYVNHKIVSNYYMISICQNKTETRDNKPRQNENKIKPLKGFIFSPLIECAVVKIIVFQCALNLNSYSTIPAGIYLLKVNNRSTVNFEHISNLVLVFLLVSLNM